jgi:hypothetical protein
VDRDKENSVKYRPFVLFAASALLIVTLVAVRPLVSAAPRLLAATQSATLIAQASQCGLIDVLVAVSPATPGATQAATQSTNKPAGTPPVATPAIVSAAPTNTPPAEGGAGEASGGDEALTTYRDTTRNFVIGYPRSWSQESTFQSGLCFTGRDASIAVQFVKGNAPADLMAYVKADEANVQASSPGYKQVYLKASTAIQGAVILGYEWDAGKSTVTEKPVRARSDRYYLVDSLGRLVIVTETEPIKQFDPDGVRDTALTYQVTK